MLLVLFHLVHALLLVTLDYSHPYVVRCLYAGDTLMIRVQIQESAAKHPSTVKTNQAVILQKRPSMPQSLSTVAVTVKLCEYNFKQRLKPCYCITVIYSNGERQSVHTLEKCMFCFLL